MAGIAERKMTSDTYNNTGSYESMLRSMSHKEDRRVIAAEKCFNHDISYMYKGGLKVHEKVCK